MCIYIYIYINTHTRWLQVRAARRLNRTASRAVSRPGLPAPVHTTNLRTKIMDFRGFDSSIILI